MELVEDGVVRTAAPAPPRSPAAPALRQALLFAGPAHPGLGAAVARELGWPLGACAIERFPDGEMSVEIGETVRGRAVYLVQPTSPPVDTHLMQLLGFVDAARRAGAERVTALVPYFGYARSDRRHGRREPITARMAADLLEAVGVGHLVTVDLHTDQIEGFFHIPVDTLSAVPILARALRERLPEGVVVVSPDAGRVPMATEYAERMGAPLAVLHKRRESGSETRVTHLVGDVRDRACLIVDDMISTGGTLVRSMEALRGAGARELFVSATHGPLLEGARERLVENDVEAVFVTDTVPPVGGGEGLHVVSVAPLLADVVRRFTVGGSLADLFDHRRGVARR